MYSQKPLEESEIVLVTIFLQKMDLEDESETIFSIDARYPLDYGFVLQNMESVSLKGLLFLLTIVSKLDAERNINKIIKNELSDKIPLGADLQTKLLSESGKFYDLSIEIYNAIFDLKSGWFGSENDVPTFQKLFPLDEKKLSDIDTVEKEAFIKSLIYLMFGDDKIDENERLFLERWINMLDLNIDMLDDLERYADISLKTLKKIQSPLMIKLLIFTYLISQEYSKTSNSDNLETVIKLKNSKKLDLNTFKDLIIKYNVIKNELTKIIYAELCSTDDNDSCNFMFENIVDYMHDRHNNPINYGLIDLNVNTQSDMQVICIDGFLSEKGNEQFDDWKQGLKVFESNSMLKGYIWPASSDDKLTTNIINGISLGVRIGSRGNVPGMVAGGVAGAIAVPLANWRDAIGKSEKAAQSLFNDIEMIHSYQPNVKIVLMGHSLGARVIYNTLIKMSRIDIKIHSAYLFGGAVAKNNKTGWMHALSAVDTKVYNFYTDNDTTLKALYKAGELFEEAIGLGKIEHFTLSELQLGEVVNIDCSDVISGHREYKNNLESLMKMVD